MQTIFLIGNYVLPVSTYLFLGRCTFLPLATISWDRSENKERILFAYLF